LTSLRPVQTRLETLVQLGTAVLLALKASDSCPLRPGMRDRPGCSVAPARETRLSRTSLRPTYCRAHTRDHSASDDQRRLPTLSRTPHCRNPKLLSRRPRAVVSRPLQLPRICELRTVILLAFATMQGRGGGSQPSHRGARCAATPVSTPGSTHRSCRVPRYHPKDRTLSMRPKHLRCHLFSPNAGHTAWRLPI